MATLEKIRSKSVFLFIIIILALLAFILGDFLNSGRSYFGTGTTMYSAGSRKVDYNDYQKMLDGLNTQGVDADEQRQAFMQQLLLANLVEEQYDLLGINVTDNEISNLMNSQMPVTQQIAQAAQMLGLPAADRATVLDAIKNPNHYGLGVEQQRALTEMWRAEEDDLAEAIKNQAFMTLVSGLFVPNEVDANAAYLSSMEQMPMAYVSMPVYTVADDQVGDPSDAELRAKYNELKSNYVLDVYLDRNTAPVYDRQGRDSRAVAINEPARAIDYVVVDIVPSNADYMAAEAEVSAVAQALEAIDGLDGLLGHNGFNSDSYTLSKADIKNDARFRELQDSDLVKVGAVKRLAFNHGTNTYTIAKVLGNTNATDSVKSSVFFMPLDETDSIKAMLAGESTIARLNEQNPGRGYTDRWARLQGSQFGNNDALSIPELRSRLASAPVNKIDFYTDSTIGLSFAYVVSEKKAPVDFVDFALVTYTVDPSQQTQSDLKMQLNSFLASNAKGDLFSAKADSLYTLRHGVVTASTPHIGNYAGTRPAVKWAMGAKPGQVSHVFDTPTEYIVVAVKEAYEDAVPYSSPMLKAQLAAEVMKDKKAAKLISDYAGKANDLEGYAQAMNSQVHNDSTVVFVSPRVAGHFGNNNALLGALAAAAPGTIVGPIQNDNEVIVFVAGEPTTANRRPYDFVNDGAQFINTYGLNTNDRRAISPALFNMLVGSRKVKNLSLNFERDAE